MTKNVATIEAINLGELVIKLSGLGFELENPETGRIHGFTSLGDPMDLAAPDVAAFLVEGNGVLLWRGHTNSLYASVILGKPRIDFGGFTVTEEEALCSSLVKLGIRFSVAHEDLTYEA